MEGLFISVLNMSLTASYVIAAIMLARLFLKKAPKAISYALWAVAGFRLAFPFSFESVFSLIPFNSQPIPQTAALGEGISFGSAAGAALRAVGDAANGGLGTVTVYLGQTTDGYPITTEAYHSEVWLMFGSYLWLIGIAALLIYSIVSIILLKRQLSGAVLSEGSIYEAENLKTSFVLGFFRPKIYIPSGLSAEEKSYIILHEQTHIKRYDHVVKLAAFLILCVHWFNPLVWVAFILMSADMEMSCDERVLKEMGSEIKKEYSASLLSLAMGRRVINGSPLAFGEGNIKGRIKNVLKFKRPAAWIVTASVVLITVLSIGLVSNRANDGTGDYDFYNFYVNGFMLGADTNKMDTSLLTPTTTLNSNNSYEFNFEEVRYSADEETGRLKKMLVNVYDDGVVSMLVAHANGKDNVSLDSNQTYQIEGIEAILGKGKTGWHDREQGLRYMEYRHKEGRISATVRFVYTDGRSDGITHRLVWVIAESSLPYPHPYPEEKQLGDLRPMIKIEDNVIIDVGESTKFTEKEINKAIDTIKNDFDFEGCTLKKLWYDEEEADYAIRGYLGTGKGSINGVEPENVIVIFSKFDVDSVGGDGSFQPNSTYTDWQFILIRDSKTSDWKIDTWGY